MPNFGQNYHARSMQVYPQGMGANQRPGPGAGPSNQAPSEAGQTFVTFGGQPQNNDERQAANR